MEFSEEMHQQAHEVHETSKLLIAVLEHNHVTFGVAMAALAWVLARTCHAQELSEFDAINKFATTIKQTYRRENDTGEEGQG